MGTQKVTGIGIIGAGNMGGALIRGLVRGFSPAGVQVYDIDPSRARNLAEEHGITHQESVKKLVDNSRAVILAVKPDSISPVLEEIKSSIRSDNIVVSIAAGVSLGSMQSTAGSDIKIVRAMPNTPALVGEGITAISAGNNVSPQEMELIKKIFQCTGKVLELPEKLMDAATALSGSGPAYVFTFIHAMTDGGVKMGIPRDKALLMAAQTVLGAARMVLESDDDPITLRGRVTSPGGTTIEAVHVLERAGFSGIVIDAIEKAAMKSKKLGEG